MPIRPARSFPPIARSRAAVSDVERYRNEAEAYAAEQSLQAQGRGAVDSRPGSDQGQPGPVRGRKGKARAFLVRQLAHAEHPDLSAFRLLWRTLGTALAGRPKLVLDPRIKGRRHVWMADPTSARCGQDRIAAPTPPAPPGRESDD